jgi:hypothetical protein
MHLILFLPTEVYKSTDLDRLKLPEDNPHGRLQVNRTLYLSITTDELTSPEHFQPGTLYAYVQVQGYPADPRATLRLKEENLFPTLYSLGSKIPYLFSKGVLKYIEPLPLELTRL